MLSAADNMIRQKFIQSEDWIYQLQAIVDAKAFAISSWNQIFLESQTEKIPYM